VTLAAQNAIPAENGVGVGDVSHLLQQFSARALANLAEPDSLWTGQPESWLQMGFQDAILC